MKIMSVLKKMGMFKKRIENKKGVKGGFPPSKRLS